jgi:hypothetical protein
MSAKSAPMNVAATLRRKSIQAPSRPQVRLMPEPR